MNSIDLGYQPIVSEPLVVYKNNLDSRRLHLEKKNVYILNILKNQSKIGYIWFHLVPIYVYRVYMCVYVNMILPDYM